MTSKWITPSIKQIWCASGCIICYTGLGMIMGHTSCLISALQTPDSPIKTDIDSVSWLAAVVAPSMAIGVLFSCILMDRVGRRRAHQLTLLPGILGWTIIYLAPNYLTLLAGRILTAVAIGGVHAVGVVMIGEYTSPQNRGMLLTIKTSAVTIGSTIVHVSGYYMHWRNFAFIALIPHIIAFLITCTWPESPTWLATKKQFDKCELEFFWLRGTNERSVKEVKEIIKAQQDSPSQLKKKIHTRGKIIDLLRKFSRKDFLKPLFTLSISAILMEASGRHYFPAFALQIMNGAMNVKMLPYYYTLCIDLIISVGSLCSSVLIRKMNRRTLLFSTGIASVIISIFVCIYLFLISNNVGPNVHPWIITFILILYFFLTNLGCAPITFTLQGELFPTAHRESGMVVFSVILSILLTGVLKLTPYMLSVTKVYGTFAINGGVMAISLIILYFNLPETKDKTLQEIENCYNNAKFTAEEKDEEELKMISNR